MPLSRTFDYDKTFNLDIEVSLRDPNESIMSRKSSFHSKSSIQTKLNRGKINNDVVWCKPVYSEKEEKGFVIRELKPGKVNYELGSDNVNIIVKNM